MTTLEHSPGTQSHLYDDPKTVILRYLHEKSETLEWQLKTLEQQPLDTRLKTPSHLFDNPKILIMTLRN